MRYQEFSPPDHLRATVASFWRFDVDERDPVFFEHMIPPDGCVSLAVAYSAESIERVVVVGPRTSALRVPVRLGIGYAGFRARPGAGAIVAGRSPAELRERVALLHDLEAGRANALCEGLVGALSIDRVLKSLAEAASNWVANTPPLDPLVVDMIDRVVAAHGQVVVRGLSGGAGVGYRQALRRFREAVGLSPKEFARLTRVRHACVMSLERKGETWAAVSANAGFSDQAHMSREFSDVFGWPPGLVREYLRRIEHVGLPGLEPLEAPHTGPARPRPDRSTTR